MLFIVCHYEIKLLVLQSDMIYKYVLLCDNDS